MKRRVWAMLLAALMLSGCGAAAATDLMETIQVETAEPAALSEESARALTQFGVGLLQRSGEGNTLLSPLSVYGALGMTAGGAAGETLTQMVKVLGLSGQALHEAFASWRKSAAESGEAKLHLANSVWFTDDPRFTVEEDFLVRTASYYGADAYKLPLDDSAKAAINRWVKENTDGMIPQALDKISPDAVMLLVNALAFEAEWETVYTDRQVHRQTFTCADGTARKVDMMFSGESVYLSDENAAGFIKYYKGCQYAFAALLPQEGMTVEDYAASLTGDRLRKIITEAEHRAVDVGIPRFEVEYTAELAEMLRAWGMSDAFDEGAADFSALGKSIAGNIFISRVLHKTKIIVDERGTKAGAVTVVETTDGAAKYMDIRRVILDRPFVYMLLDVESGVPIFIGKLCEAGK